MATRRQKLLDVLTRAEQNGVTVSDLKARIVDFTASGKSGIESFLDETLATLPTVSASNQDAVDTAKFYMQKAINALG